MRFFFGAGSLCSALEAKAGDAFGGSNYSRAGLFWFDYYDADAKALRGSEVLSNLQSVGTIMDKDQGPSLPNNETVETPSIINLAPRSRSQVREAAFD